MSADIAELESMLALEPAWLGELPDASVGGPWLETMLALEHTWHR